MAPAGDDSSASSSQPQSHAIEIPHHEASTYTYNRRRRGRHSKIPSPVTRPDAHAGPSSSSLSSDAGSWSPPPSSASAHHPATRTPTGDAPDTRGLDPSTPPRKDKARAAATAAAAATSPSGPLPPLFPPSTSPLSPSMLASSSYASVDLNAHAGDDPDEPPRLITYTKHGQGFTWNDELFLPSYMLGRYGGSGGSRGRRKQYDADFGEDDVRVVDVFVTDEEAERMMP